MKKFIDRLIERLEEESYEINLDGYIASTQKRIIEMADVNKIINELAEEYKPRTNADKIRAMTDEELAEVIFNCPITESCIHWNDEVHCQQCIREWLQSEAKE